MRRWGRLKHLFNAAFFVMLPETEAYLGLGNAQVCTLTTIRTMAA